MSDLVGEHKRYMRRRGLAVETIAKRCNRLLLFDAAVGIVGADAEDIEEFLDTRRGRDGGPIGAKTRYDWVSDLAGFYQWAVTFGVLDRDPTRRVVRPKLKQGLPRPIGVGDLLTALQLAEPTMRAWLSLMAYGGLRCIEVARLDVDCLLWDDGYLRVFGKGDKERLIPIHADVGTALQSLPLPSRGRAFRRPRGGPYPAAQISKETSLYFDSIGVDATAHMLRHRFGTELYRLTKDLRLVQEMMGHANPATTAIYAAWSREEAREAIGRIDYFGCRRGTANLFSDWHPQ